jgi:hypothetical protein
MDVTFNSSFDVIAMLRKFRIFSMQHVMKLYPQVMSSLKLTSPYCILQGFVTGRVESIMLKKKDRRSISRLFHSHLPHQNYKKEPKTRGPPKLK